MPARQPIPPEFLDLYDAERARVLRRRAAAYCATVLAIVGLSWTTSAIDLALPDAFEGPPDVTSADILTDTLFTIVYAAALADFLRRRRSRAEIVRRFQWILAVAGLIAVGVTPLVMNATWFPGATLDHTPDADFAQGLATLFTVFILHFLASLFVALSPREGLIPLVPIVAAFVAWLLLVSACTPAHRAALALAAPLAGAPGLALGWWRYRSFADRFHAGAVLQRYRELTNDLSQARRVHEALFPAPVSDGPLRLAYTYEPMRQIGGDFLFVRRLPAPRHEPAAPLLAVLVDVTGHGVAAALAVNRIHDELHRLTRALPDPAPAALINALNDFALDALAPQAVFASAFCVHLTPPEPGALARLRWAGAGHPPALLRDHRADIHRLESDAPILGAFGPPDFHCPQRERDLHPDDALLVYTDGATEARNHARDQLGVDGLAALLARSPAPAGQLADDLARRIAHFRDGPTADDLLLVELAAGAPPQGVPDPVP